jgi:hypothetical protein
MKPLDDICILSTIPTFLEDSLRFKANPRAKIIASNKRVSCTRRARSSALAEVGPAEIAEIRRVGLLGRVNALTMGRRRVNFRPRRA